MRLNTYNKFVSLSRCPQTPGDSDGFFEPLNPSTAWASIQPQQPSENGRSVWHRVGMPYHPQVNMDTRILYGTRELFVKGFQNVDEANRDLVLLCEEVIP